MGNTINPPVEMARAVGYNIFTPNSVYSFASKFR
jgi:hypothetical protein